MKLMKRIISIMLCVCMTLCVQVYTPVLAEETTSTEVIEIRTIEDLYNINNNMSGNYKLMNDIDMTEATAEGGDFDFSGNGWNPIGSENIYGLTYFSGIFDGNGYSIKNLSINVSSLPSGCGSSLYIGLFSGNSGTIKNFKLENCTISNFKTASTEYIGAICGYNTGIIENVHVDGNISLLDGKYAGGIAGYNVGSIGKSSNKASVSATNMGLYVGGIAGVSNGEIYECYNTGDITSAAAGTSSTTYTGGVAGSCSAGTISKSYNLGCIKAIGGQRTESYTSISGGGTRVYPTTNYVGGIAGTIKSASSVNSNIDECYTINSFENGKLGNFYIYAIAQISSSSNTVSNCYYSSSGTSQTGATSVNETQLQSKLQLGNFDFNETWIIDASVAYAYPQLINNRQDTDKLIDIIEWKTLPSKLAYYTGDTVQPTGGVFTVYYIDGSSEEIEITSDMLSGYDMTQTGTQTVTVTHREYTLTYEINVTQKPDIVSVSQISGPTKTEFVRGTEFDFTGWKVQVVYDNGTSEVINIDSSMTTGGDINASGTYTVSYTLGGKTVTAVVKVIPVKTTGVEIVSMPTKLTYVEGQPFDKTGLVVAATYNNGTSKVITDYEISGYSSEIGTHTVTVTYSEFETSFDVRVEEGQAIALAVTKLPTKTQYVEGQTFDKSGMVVEATYADGFTKEVTDYTISEMLPGTGTQNLTISYQDIATYISVTVIQKQLQSLEIKRLPSKTTYIEGETFTSTGLVVSGLYNDGSVSEIDGYRLSGANTTTVGSKIVTVTYSGKTATFAIIVVAATLEEISVVEPTKTSYVLGEDFDTTGMEVTAHYNNGRVEKVTDYQVSGFTGETGNNVITVTYQDKTWTFVVTVHEPYGDWVVTKDATCTTAGEKVKYCLDCDEIAVTEVIKALGHTEEIDKAVDATCTESGLTEGSHCLVCEDVLVEQEIVLATGHSPSTKWETISHATCTEAGIQVKKCTLCGETVESKDVDSTGHIVITDKGTDPTCTEPGLTEGSHCSECSEVLVAQKNISPTGHSESSDWKTTKEATCTEKGTKIKYCTECEETLETESIDSLGHEFINYRSNNDATCTADGTKTATCSHGCGEKDTVIDAGSMTEHTVIVDKAAEVTCTENGLTEGSHCFECGEVLVAQKVIPSSGHNPSVKWEVISNATCTGSGTQVKKCTECGEILESKKIEATGHSIVIDKAIASTCTQSGKTEGSHCSVCEEIIVAQNNIAPTGHKEITTGVKAATYVEAGYTGDKVCSVCGTVIAKGTSIAKLQLSKPVIKTVKSSKKKVTVKFGKVAGATQYEIRIKIGKKWKVYKTKKTSYKIKNKKLKKGKKYNIQVRAIAVSGSSKAYSAYSKAKKVKVK